MKPIHVGSACAVIGILAPSITMCMADNECAVALYGYGIHFERGMSDSFVDSARYNNFCGTGQGQIQDCNSNGIPDECDIANETSLDFDANDVPDECQSAHMPVRACCYDYTCMLTTECHCDELSGTFAAGYTSCLSAPCAMRP